MKTKRPLARVPIGMPIGAIAVYYGITMFFRWQEGPYWPLAVKEISQVHGLLLVAIPLLCGALRIATAHPRYQAAYARWLGFTPWRPGRRLPMGPLVWVWEDVAGVAVVSLLARHGGFPWLIPAAAYVIARLIVVTVAAGLTGSIKTVLAVGFAAPLIALAWPNAVEVTAVLLLFVVLDTLAVRSSLAKFPWTPTDPNRKPMRITPGTITWPLVRLGPVPLPQPISAARAVALSLLAGWVGWNLFHPAAVNNWSDVAEWYQDIRLVAAVPILGRLGYYIGFYHPPISLWGRFRTGRWIIPGYDRVFVTPAAAAVVGYMTPVLVHATGGSPAVAVGVTATGVVAVLLLGGPTLRHWQLTGRHRISAGIKPTVQQSNRRTTLASRN